VWSGSFICTSNSGDRHRRADATTTDRPASGKDAGKAEEQEAEGRGLEEEETEGGGLEEEETEGGGLEEEETAPIDSTAVEPSAVSAGGWTDSPRPTIGLSLTGDLHFGLPIRVQSIDVQGANARDVQWILPSPYFVNLMNVIRCFDDLGAVYICLSGVHPLTVGVCHHIATLSRV
jgi:hypothetical protein